MQLKFRKDKDLFVLGMAHHEDLAKLANVLTVDISDGQPRRAEQLTTDPEYKKALADGDLSNAWQSIAAELQAFGGDSFINAARSLIKGHTGVTYREILSDICARLKLELKPDVDIVAMEDQLLMGLVLSQQDKFSKEKLDDVMREAARGAGIHYAPKRHESIADMVSHLLSDPRSSYLLASVVPAVASLALPYLASLSLPVIARLVAPRVGAVLTPALTVATVVSTLQLLSSPAHRVTLPAVLEVCRIRRLALLEQLKQEKAA